MGIKDCVIEKNLSTGRIEILFYDKFCTEHFKEGVEHFVSLLNFMFNYN